MKRTPLTRKTRLRTSTGLHAKRPTPRRTDLDRVQHRRIKPKAAKGPTAEQMQYWAWLVGERGCVVTGAKGDHPDPRLRCTIHHVTSDGMKRLARDHWQVVPLRADHHQAVWDGRNSVEAMGHAKFNARHGIDLLALAGTLLAEWRDAGCP